MKNILKWTTIAFALSFFVALGFTPGANAFTVTDGLHVQSVSFLGGSILNPQGSLVFADNLDIRGYLHNETGQVVIQDDLVINGKIISNLQQEYGGVTDYRGTVFNSTADFTVGDNMMVDGYIWRRAGDIKLFDGVMVQGDLYPYNNNMYNLGTASKKWKNVYTENLSSSDLIFSNLIKGPNANFTDDVVVGDMLTVNGVATFKDTLSVSGLATLDGGITADGGVFTVANTSGNIYSGGTLDVDGNVNFDANLALAGIADIQTNIYNSTGSLVINDNLEVWGLTDLQSNVSNSMDDLTLDDNTHITGNLTSDGMTWLQSGLDVDGTAEFDGMVMLTNGPLVNQGNTQLQGNLGVWGIGNFKGDVYLGSGGDDTIALNGAEVSIADTSGSTWSIDNDGNAIINSLVNTGTSDLQGNVYNSTSDYMYIGDSLLSNGGNNIQRYLGNSANPWNEIWLDGAVVIRDAGTGSAQHSASFGFVENTSTYEATMYTDQYYMVDDGNLGTNTSTLRANRLEVTDGTNTSTYGVSTDIQGSIENSTGDLALNDNLSVTGDILPSTDATYNIGSTSLRWQDGYFSNSVNIGSTLTLSDAGISDDNSNVIVNDNLEVNGTLNSTGTTTINGTLSLDTGSITDSTGAISFGNENLSTTGTLSAGAATFTSVDAGGGLIQTTGNIQGGAATFTSLAVTNNATVGTTLGVTGLVTASNGLNVSGSNFTVGPFTVSPAGNLTGASGSNSMWTNDEGYLTSYTETDPIFGAWDKSTGITVTESQISDLQAYLTVETDPVFTAWDKSTGITITESQISDLQTYLTAETDPVFTASAAANITSGAGAPAGACTTGNLYTNTTGGAGTTLYVCEAGAWAAK